MIRNLEPIRLFIYFCFLIANLSATLSYAQSFTNSTVGNIDNSTLCPGATGTGTTANLTRTFNVSGLPTSGMDLNVGFLASHSWRGDIRLTLRSPGPSPVSVVLITEDTSNSGNDNDYNLELGDEATVTVNTGAADGPHDITLPPYQILASPNNPLSAFSAVNPNGTWTMEMCDDYAGEIGQFLQATLFFASPNDADLNLSVAIDNNLPQFTDTVTLTYDLVNGGPNSTTGVSVNAPLPSGLSFISSAGTGSYNSATGLWTLPGTLGPSSTSTLTITATVQGTGSNVVSAEVQSSSQNDPDSTPGNGVTTEDDLATLTFFPQPPPTPPALSCSAATQFVHAWDPPGGTNGWSSGEFANNYTAGTTPLNFTITGDTGNLGQISGVNTPVSQNTYTGGLVPGEYSLGISADHANAAQQIVITADIGTPGQGIEALQFRVFDIDLGGWVDRLTVTGEIDGSTVLPTTMTPSANNFIAGNSAIGRNGNAGTTASSGNVTVTFNTPIDKVIIEYGNDPSVGANPAFQIMSVHEFTMCPRLLADLSAVKSVEIYDPLNQGLYMTPGNEVLYKITATNSASADAPANDIDITDTLPDTVRFISATTTGFTAGSFGAPALPATNTDCDSGACVIRFSGGTLPINTTGEIIMRALIK